MRGIAPGLRSNASRSLGTYSPTIHAPWHNQQLISCHKHKLRDREGAMADKIKRRRIEPPASPINALNDLSDVLLQHSATSSFKVPGLLVTGAQQQLQWLQRLKIGMHRGNSTAQQMLVACVQVQCKPGPQTPSDWLSEDTGVLFPTMHRFNSMQHMSRRCTTWVHMHYDILIRRCDVNAWTTTCTSTVQACLTTCI